MTDKGFRASIASGIICPLRFMVRNRTSSQRKPVSVVTWMAVCWLGLIVGGSVAQAPTAHVRVIVRDENGKALSGVRITESAAGAVAGAALSTDTNGTATVECPRITRCTIEVALSGYLTVQHAIEPTDVAEGATIDITLAPGQQDRQDVTVQADNSGPLVETENSQTTLKVEDTKLTPLRPATLLDTLPLVPGVARTPDGRITIAGADEAHSTLLINSVNVTDPATGGFGLSVPVDSVDMVKVSLSPYLAQYGSFTAGVVSAETRRGGDKWKFDLNDPLPEFRIRSGHLEGLRSATPRVDMGGPLIANRLYLLEGTEYLVNKAEVRTLPFPMNQIRSDAINSFTQIDTNIDAKQTITASLHFAPHRLQYANLNYFDPEPVTPNADYQEDTGTVLHRWALGEGLLTSTFSGTRVAANVTPQAVGEMVLTPVGDRGSYFAQGMREATRFQWMETWTSGQIEWHGKHTIGAGSVLAHAEDEGGLTGSTTLIEDASGNLLRRIDFTPRGKFDLSDLEPAVYLQDHWSVNRALAIDGGMRAEAQTVTYTRRFAPRTGFTITPETSGRSVFRGGIGIFYNDVPLNTYAFAQYPEQVITTYDGKGKITDGPRTYINLTGEQARSKFPFISQRQVSGNFAPYSIAWNVEAQRTFGSRYSLRARYLHSDLFDQILLQPVTSAQQSAMVLGSGGSSRFRQWDLTACMGTTSARQFFFSYVRQTAAGDQTDAANYLGDLPFAIIRSRITASNPGEIPNRFLFWGVSALPWRMRIAPRIEWRNGFPYQPTDALQDYVDFSSYTQPRFPAYFTGDARVSKDVNIDPKHGVRLSVTGINLTNHTNPLQVHSNSGDPQYGTFFGNYGRHFLLDFDVLF
jgi:hypothetical protein